MTEMRDYFLCDDCANKDFMLVYNFSLRFHRVNFSDELIYDHLSEELYECTRCRKTFTKRQIDEQLARIKKERRKQ